MRLAESWILQILDTRIIFPRPFLNVMINHFSQSYVYIKMCKILVDIKRTQRVDAIFLYCLALKFCDVIGDLLPEWACLTIHGRTTFRLTSNLAEIAVSRVRQELSEDNKVRRKATKFK